MARRAGLGRAVGIRQTCGPLLRAMLLDADAGNYDCAARPSALDGAKAGI